MKDKLILDVSILKPHVFGFDANVLIVRFERFATNRTVERGHRCITLPIAMNTPQTVHVAPRQSARKSRSLIGLLPVENTYINLNGCFLVLDIQRLTDCLR